MCLEQKRQIFVSLGDWDHKDSILRALSKGSWSRCVILKGLPWVIGEISHLSGKIQWCWKKKQSQNSVLLVQRIGTLFVQKERSKNSIYLSNKCRVAILSYTATLYNIFILCSLAASILNQDSREQSWEQEPQIQSFWCRLHSTITLLFYPNKVESFVPSCEWSLNDPNKIESFVPSCESDCKTFSGRLVSFQTRAHKYRSLD